MELIFPACQSYFMRINIKKNANGISSFGIHMANVCSESTEEFFLKKKKPPHTTLKTFIRHTTLLSEFNEKHRRRLGEKFLQAFWIL